MNTAVVRPQPSQSQPQSLSTSFGKSGRNSRDHHHNNHHHHDNKTDSFMMTSMIDVVNSVLKDPQNFENSFMMSNTPPPYVGSSTAGMGNPAFPPVLNLMQVPYNGDNGLFESLIQVPSLKSNPCQCGNDHFAFCIECQEFLCSNCMSSHQEATSSESHQIILSTSSHSTTPPTSLSNDAPISQSKAVSSQSTEPPPTFEEDELDSCVEHPEEKLAYFCSTCVVLVCETCVKTDHPHHNCSGLREAYMHFGPRDVKDLLGKAQVELDLLKGSLEETRHMNARVSDKQQEAISNVSKIFQTHREKLAKREMEIVAQVKEIADLRTSALAEEDSHISKALNTLQSLTQEGERLLQNGNRSKILVTYLQLEDSLKSCYPYTTSRTPCEDDSFILKSSTSSVQSALKNLCMLTTTPYPPLCTVMGEGFYHPRVNRLCTVVVTTKDRAGEPCLEGGERLFVQLKAITNGNDGGMIVTMELIDNLDGSYSINFRPRVKGEHQLVVAMRGQHVQGSPFTLHVDGGREYGRLGVVTRVFGSEGCHTNQFCRPWGICADQKGNIIVGDRSNHRIQVFDINGVFKHKFGTEGVRQGQFNRPAGVAITREGDVVVADKDNHRIQVLKIDGTFLFMFGSKGGNDGQMIYPYDVAVNQLDGRIGVTDTGNHRLLIFSHDGILLGKFGYKGYLCGHFDSPRGISFDDEGHIIVTDFNVHHILVIHPDGTTARILGSQGNGNGQFMRPQGLAVDHMGNYIVADTRNNRIVIMNPKGNFIGKFGTPGTGPGQFDRPTSITVLPDGHIAVVDFGNSRIQIF